MTDKELLEMAAKASGIRVQYTEPSLMTSTVFQTFFSKDGCQIDWNPLTDDGDALRLAVECGIDVQQFTGTLMVEAWKHPHQACGEDYGTNPCAATRRAIVRASAEIGKVMDAKN